jgi:hypothetical protein
MRRALILTTIGEELNATLFAIADIRQDVREIRVGLKEEDNGQGPEDES